MNVRLAMALLLPAVAACSDSALYNTEMRSDYYNAPAEKTTTERVERREITHWKGNPRDKKRVGFLYKMETKVKGSRAYRDSWYIYDRYGKTAVGFIDAEGRFFRFDAAGRREEKPIGEWQIATTGLKIFFGFPLTDNIDLEEVDPYRDASTR